MLIQHLLDQHMQELHSIYQHSISTDHVYEQVRIGGPRADLHFLYLWQHKALDAIYFAGDE